MKIAFIEPGSGIVQFFSTIAHELPQPMQAIFFSRVPKVRSKLNRMGHTPYPIHRYKAPARLTREQLRALISPKVLQTASTPEAALSKAARLAPQLESFLLEERIDAVFLWNGSGLTTSLVSAFARQHGIRTLYGENGYLPNTMQLDPEGVNYFASITREAPQSFMSHTHDETRWKALQHLLKNYRNGTLPEPQPPLKEVSASLWSKILDTLNKPSKPSLHWLRKHRYNQNIPGHLPDLPEKFVLVPLQVVKDSQLLLHSPLLSNDTISFVRECHQAVQTLGDDYRLVVKLHPADLRHSDYGPLADELPQALFVSHQPVNQLLERCRAVITINSTVGFEALIYHKPVITLGRNFYTFPGITYPVKKLDQLAATLKTAIQSPIDDKRLDQFIYYIYDRYLTHGSWKNYSPQSRQAVTDRIVTLCLPPADTKKDG